MSCSGLLGITCVRYSALIQIVRRHTSPLYYRLMDKFREKIIYSWIAKTLFNVRGEPRTGIPAGYFKCSLRTEMDNLFAANCLLNQEQPAPCVRMDHKLAFLARLRSAHDDYHCATL